MLYIADIINVRLKRKALVYYLDDNCTPGFYNEHFFIWSKCRNLETLDFRVESCWNGDQYRKPIRVGLTEQFRTFPYLLMKPAKCRHTYSEYRLIVECHSLGTYCS